MGFLKIDENLQKSDAVAEFFSGLIMDERNTVPKLSISNILGGKIRPGLDSSAIAASVISRFKEAGIPTGPLSEGVPNAMEELVRILLEEIVDAIQNEMRVDVAVDIGMQVLSQGANAGGPIVTTGSNPTPHTAIGVAR